MTRKKNNSAAPKKASNSAPKKRTKPELNMKNVVFALDIGTRSIVGVLGTVDGNTFDVFDYEQRFHTSRAMRDGQIEDIPLVARTVTEVKEALEKRHNVKLRRVCIAAAGRSLRTIRTSYVQDLVEEDEITPEQMHSIEYSAISAALDTFTESRDQEDDAELAQNRYSCVGYDVVSYLLDDYPLANPLGHRGKALQAEIIAAFLPFSVVRSLYSVTELCHLEVESLTLEPIAAINAVVPPDVRLLNIAIADVGAGTSDIGISKGGSIVAYDMVTSAGDGITEEIMRQYLVDFATAEAIKFQVSAGVSEISYQDILGLPHTCPSETILAAIEPSVSKLASAIAERILVVNDGAPTALFLVGGGSQTAGLCEKVAGALDLPPERVTLGGRHPYRNITVHDSSLLTPEFVTPLGIGATSQMTHIHDLFSVTVNGDKVTLPGTDSIKVLDALLLAGIKASNLIGRSAAPVTYYINEEKKTMRGLPPIPGELYVNKAPASLDTPIRQGDSIVALFAQHGKRPFATLADVCRPFSAPFAATVNGQPVAMDYVIKAEDHVTVIPLTPASQPAQAAPVLPIAPSATMPQVAPSVPVAPVAPVVPAAPVVQAAPVTSEPATEAKRAIRVCVNDQWMEAPVGNEPPMFLDMLNLINIDLTQAKGELVLTINGLAASYTDTVRDGDAVEIRWK